LPAIRLVPLVTIQRLSICLASTAVLALALVTLAAIPPAAVISVLVRAIAVVPPAAVILVLVLAIVAVPLAATLVAADIECLDGRGGEVFTRIRDMLNDKPLQLDFTQGDYARYGFTRAPLSPRASAHWDGIFHRQPGIEVPEHYDVKHTIGIHLDPHPRRLELHLAGSHRRADSQLGDIIVMPANVSHSIACSHESEFMMLCIEPALFTQSLSELTDSNAVELIPQFLRRDPLMYQLGLALKAELETGASGSRLYAESLSNTLLMHLLRHYSSRKNISDYSGKLSKVQLEQVVHYIDEHLSQDISLAALGAVVQMGSRHFSRLFKQSTGFSPYQYLIKCRVERAKKLLQRSSLSIAEIAQAVGFANQSHLNRHFKRWFGVSPKSVR
jgi:AraC family transcriptional regulator